MLNLIKAIKKTLILIGILFFLAPGSSLAQISLDSDTTSKEEYYRFLDIDFELEKIRKYIRNTEKFVNQDHKAAEIDSSLNKLSKKIHLEQEEFDQYNHESLSKFFLINTRAIWLGYNEQLKNWQDYVYETLNELEKQNMQLSERRGKWETTLSKLQEQKVPRTLKIRLSEVITDIRRLQDLSYKSSIKFINLETKITDELIFVKNVVYDIEELHNNYRSKLFSVTGPEIWRLNLKESYSGKITHRLTKAWYENTKSFKNNMEIYKKNLSTYLFVCILSLILFIALRISFLKYFGSSLKNKKFDLNYILIKRPWSSIISLFILYFFLIFTHIPLALVGIMSLFLLWTTFIALNPYLKKDGRSIIIRFIILLSLNIMEIVWWYFGDYARIFIAIEAMLGMLFTLEYLNKHFTHSILPNLRFRYIIRFIRYPVFIMFAIAFLANTFGFLNLAVQLIKISVKMTSAVIITIGMWHMAISFIVVLLDLVRKNEKLQIRKHLPLIKKRATQIFRIIFIYLLFNVALNILEVEAPFYNFLDELMNSERTLLGVPYTYTNIFNFIFSLFITYVIYKLLGILFDNGNFKQSQNLRGVPAAIGTTLKVIVVFIGLMIALRSVGFDMTKLSIIIGALGVGIGFGLQNIVNNFISGLILIYERPIQVGDIIELGALMGEVKSIGIRSSNIRTYDGSEVIVPNSNLVSDQLINWTLSDNHRRMELIVGVAYGTDPQKVIDILTNVADNHPQVVKFPEPRVLFNEFGDSSLNFRLLVWVLFENGLSVKSDLSVAIDKAFKKHQIEIPFPQLDLHMKSNTEEVEKEYSDLSKEKNPNEDLIK